MVGEISTPHYRVSCCGHCAEYEAPPRCRLSYKHLGDDSAPREHRGQPPTSDNPSHVHVEVAIKDAFAAARHQIEALGQRANGKVKLHEVEAHGRVSSFLQTTASLR